MISIIEAMEALLSFDKKNPGILRMAAGVEIFTDRYSVTTLVDPRRLRDWRRNGWKTYEDKPVKDKDLLDKIDKTRTKLAAVVRGSVSIGYKRERKNKVADKLSKEGKKIATGGRKTMEKKLRRVARRIFGGNEIQYPRLKEDGVFEAHVYAWERVGDRYEVCFEVSSGEYVGKIVKAYISEGQKAKVHRGHYYTVRIDKVFTHHITTIMIHEVLK